MTATAAAAAGCDVGDPSYQPVDAPPLHLVDVLATTDLDDDFHPIRTSLAPDGSTLVLPTASFVLKFDRFLLPGSAIRQSVCLQSDLNIDVQSANNCESGVLLAPTYDPIRRQVIYRRGLDEARLALDTRYRLTVLPPAENSGAAGFRAFDGAALEGRVQIDFMTVAQEPTGATDEVPPGGDLFCAHDPECLSACGADPSCAQSCEIGVARQLREGCAAGGACHREAFKGATLLRGAAAALDLEEAEDIVATAMGKVAHQTQMGEHADEGDSNPTRFGRAMPIIDPSNPGNSYLLYKIVVGPNVQVTRPANPSDPASLIDDPPSPEEIARLRSSVVAGLPMPPSYDADPRNAVSFFVEDADLISAWIAQGAPVRDCSQPPFQ